MTPALSVVVPAFNEAARLGPSLQTILAHLRAHHPDAELIVVDDGSRDETSEVALACGAAEDGGELPEAGACARLIRYQPNRGKGYAVRRGLLAARGPIVMFMDADLATPIGELAKLMVPLARGEADVSFGSRMADRTLIGTHQPWYREAGGRLFNFVLRQATRLPFQDTQCGFKAFRASVCRPIIEAGLVDRFGFDVELLYVSIMAGLRLAEVPVEWHHRDGSKVCLLRDGPRMMRDIFAVRQRLAAGAYDAAIQASIQVQEREASLPRGRPAALDIVA